MFTSLKSLVWGENLASDPVGAFLGFALRQISHGSIVLDVAQLSQVGDSVTHGISEVSVSVLCQRGTIGGCHTCKTNALLQDPLSSKWNRYPGGKDPFDEREWMKLEE